MYIKRLYKRTVHLPLILGYGTCLEKTKINKIIATRLGLDKEIEVDLTGKVYGDKKKLYIKVTLLHSKIYIIIYIIQKIKMVLFYQME
jgi:hypothetical protein